MRRYTVRVVALLLLLSVLPMCSGCAAGGIIEFALTLQKLYGLWKLYQLIQDGQFVQGAIATWEFTDSLDYELVYYDANNDPIASETGTWTVDNGVLVLQVSASTVDPSATGTTVRLPGFFTDEAATELSLSRRVHQGQVTVSQEMVYRRQP